jgi:hypothetical protein
MPSFSAAAALAAGGGSRSEGIFFRRETRRPHTKRFSGRWFLSGLFDERNGLFTYHGLWTITSSSRIISLDYDVAAADLCAPACGLLGFDPRNYFAFSFSKVF